MTVATNPDHVALSRLDRRAGDGELDVDQILKAARRQVWVIAACCTVGVLGGIGYIAQSVPRYTATAVLIIDSAKDKSTISASIADLTYDSGAIDSQLEVLKSEGTASSVLNTLRLTNDPRFVRPPVSGLSRWMASARALLQAGPADVGGSEAEKAGRARRGALDQLETNLGVRRVGRSYVINVDYTAADPDLAATVANGFAQAYVGDQLAAKFNAMQQTKDWLETRIADFKAKWVRSDLALQAQRAQLGLITSEGKLVGDQQVVQLGAQLTAAQSDTARAVARYDQLQRLIASGDVEADIPDTLTNAGVNDLRATYRRTEEIARQARAEGGPGAALDGALAGYKAQILGEMRRIAEAYKSEADVAQAKEDGLRKALSQLAQRNTVDDQRLVGLRVQEGEVESNRRIYGNLLERYQEVQERQTFPEAEARIITSAAPPTAPAYPKRPIVITLAALLGGLAGLGAAAWRESRDRVFRTAADARASLPLDFLGMLPAMKVPRPPARPDRGRSEPGQIRTDNPALRFSIDNPISPFSETLQSIKVAVDLRVDTSGAKVIGIISVKPNEGKTTVSKNLASLLSRMGSSVLLVDGDLHQRGLTTALANDAEAGLLEVMQGRKRLAECLRVEAGTGLAFLPTVVQARLPHFGHVLGSPKMREVIAEGRRGFDYVLVDLPPVAPIVSVRAAASMFDGFVVVVEWGRTPQAMVKNTILADAEIMNKCLGVVYNKVEMRKIKLYEGLGSKAFHHEEFSKYLKSGALDA